MKSAKSQPFKLTRFVNPSGQKVWRVSGSLNRTRIRENFPDRQQAERRHRELELLRLGTAETRRQETWLDVSQLAVAHDVFQKIPDADEVKRAIAFWLRKGREIAGAGDVASRVTLDDAFGKFVSAIAAEPMRDATRRNLTNRVRMFVNAAGHTKVADIQPEHIDHWLSGRDAGLRTRTNDRAAVSRFFSWCAQRGQRYVTANPVREVRLSKAVGKPPEILTLKQAMRLLTAAKRTAGGRYLSYVALQLFGAMRPAETLRVDLGAIRDGLLRVEAGASKVKTFRAVEVHPVLAAWLDACPDKTVRDPMKYRKAWDRIRKLAKVTRWPADVLRHTGVSFLFRRTGSFGLTAEQAGNSEQVIKSHYLGRVSAEDCAAFWSLFPTRHQRQAARQTGGHVIAMPRRSAA